MILILKKRFKYSFCLCLVVLLGIYSIGINAMSWLNDAEMVHLHLMSYSDHSMQEVHEDHDDSPHNSNHSHSHSHRHSPDTPIHEHSHPEIPCLHFGSFALSHPFTDSLSYFLNSSESILVSSNHMFSTSLLHGIFRPPIS